ncbi:unnamed protein product [Acanthosepion pharaonis]|uniref:DUF7041 domain-containing protein n=1 Tax=Acanthosepion pharaonis TaxID=158019 RepID=A0A812CH64_ACAPH|nr:unnamed protein product [Sepia pharaonis]
MDEEKTAAVSAVNTVSLAYFKADPALFFAQLESECELRGITSQKTKFNLAVSKLPLEAVQAVREIIISPPKDKPYYKLKEELVRRTSVSRQKKLSQLLHEEQLGDSKPSQFLRRLQHLAGESNEDGIIRHIFLQRLPPAYHAVLAAVGEDAPVEKLAEIADNVADLTSGCTAPVSAVQTQEPDPLARLLEGQRRLEARMEDLERDGCRRLAFTAPQSRGRVKAVSKDPMCYLHRKFGDRANYCKPPCSFNSQQGKA